MTALALQRIVTEALADLGSSYEPKQGVRGRPRSTTWLAIEHGFGIRHYASGRNVYIVVQTRMAGRLRTVTIGPASILSETQAASVARQVLAHAAVGSDPAEDRRRIRRTPSFPDFLDEYWTKCSPGWKASTRETHGIYRRGYLDDAFAGKYVDEIDAADVAKWFASVSDRGGPGAANRCLSIVQAMMNRAEQWGYRLERSNPAVGIRRNKNRRCERFLSEEELARLGSVLAVEREGESVRALAVLLLLLTGCRVSEILTLQWGDVSGRRLKLRDSKTGPRTVWLGTEAAELIQALPRYGKNPWLFWDAVRRKPIRTLQCFWDGVRAEAALPTVRLHDLRHSFASHAAMRSETLPMIGRLLGHAKVASTARYAHLDDAHVLAAAEKIGDAIERMMAAGLSISRTLITTKRCDVPLGAVAWPP